MSLCLCLQFDGVIVSLFHLAQKYELTKYWFYYIIKESKQIPIKTDDRVNRLVYLGWVPYRAQFYEGLDHCWLELPLTSICRSLSAVPASSCFNVKFSRGFARKNLFDISDIESCHENVAKEQQFVV